MSAEVHSYIADLIHQQRMVDQDGFALAASRSLDAIPKWSKGSITSAIGAIETDLFRRHTDMPKKTLLNLLAESILKRWRINPKNATKETEPAMIKILFVAANPTNTVTVDSTGAPLTRKPLGLDHEFREIQNKLRGSEHRDHFQLVSRWAARPDDLLQAFNEERPQIVHFSGHGTDTDELVLLDDRGTAKVVSKAAIESLFRTMKGSIRLVVLNACFSMGQAAAITKHIDCAIGMKVAIGDKAAITFSAAFYRAIGFGHSVKDSFEQALTALQLEGIVGDTTPTLISRKGVNPRTFKLAPTYP